MKPLTRRAFLFSSGLLACGCALTANKVPTPAADLTTEDLAALPKPPPGERYFLIFFGSHDLLRRPAHTHTWATLVRVRDNGPGATVASGCVDPSLDVFTISWLPVTGEVKTRNYEVEPGRNFELHETLKLVYDTNQSVAVWGPYEVWHGFAHRFLVQKAYLDSGAVGYQAVDMRGESARLGNGCNCFHAITDMDPIYPRWRYPLAFYGKPATANLVRRFMKSPIWIGPPNTHDQLLSRLGLDQYPLQKRYYIGRVEPYNPHAPADLDVKARPIPLPSAPGPKDPAPKIPVPIPGNGLKKP